MAKLKISEICEERLKLWMEKLIKENATPVLLIGVAHKKPVARLVVCTLDDVTDEGIRDFIKGALKQLEENM